MWLSQQDQSGSSSSVFDESKHGIENDIAQKKKNKRKRVRQIVSAPVKRRQTVLQFGQRPLTKCEICGQVTGKQHTCSIAYSGGGRLLGKLNSIGIYEVASADSMIRGLVAAELGHDASSLAGRAFIAVSGHQVVGFCLCRQLDRAFVTSGTHLIRSAPVPIDLGVDAIWVHCLYRHKRLASTLIDFARKSFFFAFQVPLHRLAFSQPTADGLAFAQAYLKKNDQSPADFSSLMKSDTSKTPQLLLYDDDIIMML